MQIAEGDCRRRHQDRRVSRDSVLLVWERLSRHPLKPFPLVLCGPFVAGAEGRRLAAADSIPSRSTDIGEPLCVR